jgi:hypothetical protein
MGKTTLRIGFVNTENLFSPGVNFYGSVYTAEQYEEKVNWIGRSVAALQVDVCAFTEIGEDPDSCLDDVKTVVNDEDKTDRPPFEFKKHFEQSRTGTPIRVAILSRYDLTNEESLTQFPTGFKVDLPVPGNGDWVKVPFEKYSRPVGKALVNLPNNAKPFNLFVVHLKSKRPKLSDEDDVLHSDAIGSARSAIMRNLEAAALRCYMNTFLPAQYDTDPGIPTVLVGDFNDVPNSVPLENIRGPFDKDLEPQTPWTLNDKLKLFSAARLHMKKSAYDDKLFSYVHDESFTLIDQAFVTMHLTGKFKRLEVYNDHVLRHQTIVKGTEQEKRWKSTVSDHGFVVLELNRML